MLHGEIPLANINATRGKGASAVWQNNMMEQVLYQVPGGVAESSLPPMYVRPEGGIEPLRVSTPTVLKTAPRTTGGSSGLKPTQA